MRRAQVALIAGVALTASGATLITAWLYLSNGFGIFPSPPNPCDAGDVCLIISYFFLRDRIRTVLSLEYWVGISVLGIGVATLTLARFRLLKRAQ